MRKRLHAGPPAFIAAALLSLAVPAAAGQTSVVSVQGAAGSNINVGGNTQAVSVGFSVGRHVDLLVSGERIHMPTEVTLHPGGSSATRGGTTTFVSGEIRIVPLGLSRVSPYAIAGAGRGISRPNVNEHFPDEVTNDAALLFFGGGIRVPATERLSVFADVRFVLQLEREGTEVFLFVPIRGGLAWRF